MLLDFFNHSNLIDITNLYKQNPMSYQINKLNTAVTRIKFLLFKKNKF